MKIKKKQAMTAEEPVGADARYAIGWKRVQSFYLALVIGCSAVLLLAVALAIFSLVWVGVLTAVAVGIVYRYFTADELKKRLGLTYENTEGAISLTGFDAKGEDELYIPARLFWTNVETLSCQAGAKGENQELVSLHLPRGLKQIEAGALDGCDALTQLLYEGSAAEWDEVVCQADLSSLTVLFDVPYPVIPQKEAKQNTEPPHFDQEEDVAG